MIENDADNSSVTVTLNKKDCMKEMMDKYCERKNLRRQKIRFKLYCQTIEDYHTPSKLGM